MTKLQEYLLDALILAGVAMLAAAGAIIHPSLGLAVCGIAAIAMAEAIYGHRFSRRDES